MLVDGKDNTKRVHISAPPSEQKALSISNIEFTQSLLEEAYAVLDELRFAEVE